MTLRDFMSRLNVSKSDYDSVSKLFNCAINEFSDSDKDTKPNEKNIKEIKDFLKGIEQERFTDFANKANICRSICEKEQECAKEYNTRAYENKLVNFHEQLNTILILYREEQMSRQKKEETILNEAVVDSDESYEDNAIVAASLKYKIDGLKKDIDKVSSFVNEKTFSLLINTVAILGIFATISFTGFSEMSILSNIDIEFALQSYDNFIRAIFFLLLVSLLSYNLLLLLIYFLFKISRPLLNNKNNEDSIFAKVVDLTPFFWIDGILAFVTVALFAYCYIWW